PTQTIDLLSQYLASVTQANDALPASPLTRFHARTIPTIDIHGYLARILKYAPCTSDAFLALLIYLERM
ncbi:hypothetical protein CAUPRSCDRAFT_4583, partial [Caulochytrium protostelioides]